MGLEMRNERAMRVESPARCKLGGITRWKNKSPGGRDRYRTLVMGASYSGEVSLESSSSLKGICDQEEKWERERTLFECFMTVMGWCRIMGEHAVRSRWVRWG